MILIKDKQLQTLSVPSDLLQNTLSKYSSYHSLGDNVKPDNNIFEQVSNFCCHRTLSYISLKHRHCISNQGDARGQ